MHLASLIIASAAFGGHAFLPPTNPTWPPTYNMSMSTISMQCNSSGWSSPERGAQFGIISYDWSNGKDQWAAAKPMDCEERLLKQCEMTKEQNPDSHVFAYRNVVKALPWYSSIREKMDDPAYSGWFLKFDPAGFPYNVSQCAAEDGSKCSVYYHDQGQTPAVPTAAQPHPDGSCADGVCDCGGQPCGEYLWDHRNGSMLRDWLVEHHVGGPTGIGSPSIDGLFMDDYWCSTLICDAHNDTVAGCPCDDKVQGATEVNVWQQRDMGLSDEDIRDITLGWNETMTAIEKKLLDENAYSWWLMDHQANANAYPHLLNSNATKCLKQLREACRWPWQSSSPWQQRPQLFGLTINGTEHAPQQLEQDVAFFLLARGPYAWLGWGVWGMTWPFNPEPAHGELPPNPHGVPRPEMIDQDYGEPLGLCHEHAPGLFKRKWTKTTVSLDCHSFTATFDPIIVSVV